jgi:hypothetical protein
VSPIGGEIFIKVGGCVFGNFVTSAVAEIGTCIWMLSFAVSDPILLALLVALLDPIPLIGFSIGGATVAPRCLWSCRCLWRLPPWASTSAAGWPRTTCWFRIMGQAVQIPAGVLLATMAFPAWTSAKPAPQ